MLRSSFSKSLTRIFQIERLCVFGEARRVDLGKPLQRPGDAFLEAAVHAAQGKVDLRLCVESPKPDRNAIVLATLGDGEAAAVLPDLPVEGRHFKPPARGSACSAAP